MGRDEKRIRLKNSNMWGPPKFSIKCYSRFVGSLIYYVLSISDVVDVIENMLSILLRVPLVLRY